MHFKYKNLLLFFLFNINFYIQNQENNSNNEIILIDFILQSEKELPLCTFQIGTPFQNINLHLDLSAERTWLSSEIFLYQNSISYKTSSIPARIEQGNFAYSGIWVSDIIKVGKKELTDFNFLLVDKIENNSLLKGVLSLGRFFESKQFNFVYKLNANSSTFHNLFSLQFYDNNSGKLIIGDLTEEINKNNDLIHKCSLLNEEPKIKWMCVLSSVYIGEGENDINIDKNTNEKEYYVDLKGSKVIYINKPVSFETLYNKIYVPREFMNYLKENVFYDDKDKREICKFNEDANSAVFVCIKSEIEHIKNINFVLSGKLALSIPNSNLFKCNEDECYYAIEFNNNYSSYIFGLPVFKTYQIYFDYFSEELFFYGNKYKSYVKIISKESHSVRKFFIILIIIVLLIIIIGVCLIYFLRRKNKRRKLIEEEIYENF